MQLLLLLLFYTHNPNASSKVAHFNRVERSDVFTIISLIQLRLHDQKKTKQNIIKVTNSFMKYSKLYRQQAFQE